MTTCPKCKGQSHPGYFTVKCSKTGRIAVIRCDVCKGWGFTTLLRIMGWEVSL